MEATRDLLDESGRILINPHDDPSVAAWLAAAEKVVR